MRNYSKRTSRGFTLIEVMIALVVAVVGILAMIQLSGAFLQSVSDSDQRTVAYALAERTLEDLRSYDNLSGSTAGETYFEDMATGSTANVTVSSGQSAYTFDIDWAVSDYVVSGGVATLGASGAIYRTYKEVTVTVSWSSPVADSISLSSIIAGIDPNAAAIIDDISNVGGDSPEVEYTAGEAPDVIAIDVADGKLKETTKPLPDVEAKNESTEVKFETITYKDSGDNNQLIQEDFVTVNCICTLDTTVGTGNGLTPTYQEFVSETAGMEDKLGQSVDAVTGTVTSLGGALTQSAFCGRCCAYHHDSDDNTTGVKYKTGASTASGTNGDHVHYKITDSSTEPVTLAIAGNGDNYLEACRFKRVDGIYRLAADWNIVEVNVFNESYLASGATGLTNYVDYIKDMVQHEIYTNQVSGATASQIASSAAPTLSPTRDFTTTDGQSNQVLSRTIYLDSISHDTALQTYLAGLTTASMAEHDWLEFIPFYELNSTLLSTWSSSSSSIATVTSEDIDNIVDEATDYYGTYSRGLVVGGSGVGSTNITATMKNGNTGILGNTYANPSTLKGKDNRIVPSPTEFTGSLSVGNGACTASSCFISGVITKAYSGNNPAKFSDINFANADPVTLSTGDIAIEAEGTGTDNGADGTCTFGLNTGTQISYSCEVNPSAGNGDGTWVGEVTVTSVGAEFDVGPDGGSSSDTSYSISGTAQVDQDFSLGRP